MKVLEFMNPVLLWTTWPKREKGEVGVRMGCQSHFRLCYRGSLWGVEDLSLGSEEDGLKFSLSTAESGRIWGKCLTHGNPVPHQ